MKNVSQHTTPDPAHVRRLFVSELAIKEHGAKSRTHKALVRQGWHISDQWVFNVLAEQDEDETAYVPPPDGYPTPEPRPLDVALCAADEPESPNDDPIPANDDDAPNEAVQSDVGGTEAEIQTANIQEIEPVRSVQVPPPTANGITFRPGPLLVVARWLVGAVVWWYNSDYAAILLGLFIVAVGVLIKVLFF